MWDFSKYFSRNLALNKCFQSFVYVCVFFTNVFIYFGEKSLIKRKIRYKVRTQVWVLLLLILDSSIKS